MPSFDTVLEADLVKVKNAVENSAKEIGTRFDFKGTAAAIELKDKDIILTGDGDFQIDQINDPTLRAVLSQRFDEPFDPDIDGYGTTGLTTRACAAPSGYVAGSTDCNDSVATINPGASARCDLVDNDCDGAVDESAAVDAGLWYRDVDGDGFGTSGTSTRACTAPSGYVSLSTD
jgi:hypothetical protein